LTANPFETPMDKATFKQLLQDKVDLESTIESIIEERTELENLVEDLKGAKDKSAVAAIVKKRRKTTQFDEFQELCKEVTAVLSCQSSIINGIIFKSYSGKDIKIGWEGNREELDDALANDYIDEELDVKWDSTKEMEKILKSLNKVSKFIGSELGNDFYEQYKDEYSSPLEIKNKRFWEEVFNIYISFN